MTVLLARGIGHAWGGRWILRGCDLAVGPGDRIGLVGPNGSGKSTLLSILAGRVAPDVGEVVATGRCALLAQAPAFGGETVGDALTAAVGWHGALVARYEAALAEGDVDGAARWHDRLDQVGWRVAHRVDAVCDRIGVADRSTRLAVLSGGERRRLALAVTLVSGADVLLLDEPTNHLDVEAIGWLEAFLAGYRGAVVVVTHDRALLESVANRIVEIEEGRTVAYDDHGYADYLVARAQRRERLEQEEARHLELLAREAAWAARSPSARATKQKARLERLRALRERPRLARTRDLVFGFSSGVRGGSTSFELHGATRAFGDKVLFADLDLTIRAGDRIGLLGPNGAGKTTFLRVLLGRERLDRGEIVRGRRVRIGLLDQERTGLSDDDTLREAVAGGNDRVTVGGRTVHVASFLERFLFPREMHDQHVGGLSGGERARLLLARLLLQGSNVLLLDEPTNDLDLTTLRVLEEALIGFDGTVVVVTHDRAFLDRVCTRVLGFDGRGGARVYADRHQYAAAMAADRLPAVDPAPSPRKPRTSRRRGLSFREARELEALPSRLEALEAELAEVDARLADPATYRDGTDIAALTRTRGELADALERGFARWEELEARSG